MVKTNSGQGRGATSDAVDIAPSLDRAIDLLSYEATAVGENPDIAGAGGGAGAGGAEGAPVGGVAPSDDGAIVFDGREGGAGGEDLRVAGAGGLASTAISRVAPGEDRPIVLQRGEGLFIGSDRHVAGAGRRGGL